VPNNIIAVHLKAFEVLHLLIHEFEVLLNFSSRNRHFIKARTVLRTGFGIFYCGGSRL